MNSDADVRFLEQNLDQPALKLELRRALQQVFADPDQLPGLFTEDYVQTTDGSTSNREEFEAHVRHLAHVVTSLDFEVLDVAQQGSSIADRHLVHVVYQDGRRATIEVFLFGEISAGRLQRVHEVTRVLSGDESLQYLGTARD
jgi:hypothetical protein